MAALTSIPTVADYLDDATDRLDRLTRVEMTPAEYALWRVLAQHNAALRLLAQQHGEGGEQR
jgi:hypothetical protein